MKAGCLIDTMLELYRNVPKRAVCVSLIYLTLRWTFTHKPSFITMVIRASSQSLCQESIFLLDLRRPVTAMNLHQLFELSMVETLDIGQKAFAIGYNWKCKGPFCLAYGNCEVPLGDSSDLSFPYHMTMQSIRLDYQRELLGGPCICREGRVIV